MARFLAGLAVVVAVAAFVAVVAYTETELVDEPTREERCDR